MITLKIPMITLKIPMLHVKIILIITPMITPAAVVSQ
jgi:hypothetical protein